MKVEEICVCCNGKGLVTTEFSDDWSSCMTCNGAGSFKYEAAPQEMNGDCLRCLWEP